MSDSAYSNEASATTLGIAKPLIKNCVIQANGTAAIGVENVSGTSVVAYSKISGDTYDLKQTAGTLNVLRNGYDTTHTSGTITRLDGDIPGSIPASSIPLTSGDILVGNGSNVAAAVTMSGDATIANTGALTLKNTGPGATGPIGNSTNTPVITIDAQGRVTALTSAAIASGGTPAGGTGDIQYNNAGSFAADAGNFSYDPAGNPITATGVILTHGITSSALTGTTDPYLAIGGGLKSGEDGNILYLLGGDASGVGKKGGDVYIQSGAAAGGGSGVPGKVKMGSNLTNFTNFLVFDTSNITSTDRTATFQDKSGTVAYLDDINSASTILENQVFGG